MGSVPLESAHRKRGARSGLTQSGRCGEKRCHELGSRTLLGTGAGRVMALAEMPVNKILSLVGTSAEERTEEVINPPKATAKQQ
jgi:hypothetical protein